MQYFAFILCLCTPGPMFSPFCKVSMLVELLQNCLYLVDVTSYNEKAITVVGLLLADRAVQYVKRQHMGIYTMTITMAENSHSRQECQHFTKMNSTSDEQCLETMTALFHHVDIATQTASANCTVLWGLPLAQLVCLNVYVPLTPCGVSLSRQHQ